MRFMAFPAPTTDEILAARPARNTLDPWKPVAFHVEPERAATGRIEDVATIFLAITWRKSRKRLD